MTLLLDEISADEVHELDARFEHEPASTILRWTWDRFGATAAIGTSFQGAGLVTIHQALRAGCRFPVFTIDTQFLFPETLALKERLEDFFGIEIEALLPAQTPEEQAAEHGPELWKRSPDLCCILRKVEPLQKKLAELNVWITGLRRDQSAERKKTRVIELYKFDVLRDRYILKLNPVVNWSRNEVFEYIRAEKIPYNPLLDRGYRSIGCMQCTRPVAEGESERAGRWTGFDKAECGIHTFLGENI
jgi:phosphoadenosine phosphosulfate reductase